MSRAEHEALSSVRDIARAVRSGEISAVEVLDAHVARIERINPRLNAIVRLDLERARRAARNGDEARARGEALGPLHGVPFTLKDLHACAGVPSSLGTKGSEVAVEHDGVIARRLKAAGAIFLGKTNMGLSVQTLSEQFGRTSNPHDVQRTTGGSSGGAAAAVAAGLSAFDVGSDISGSIRMPAHFTGVVGFRPTMNRIPAADVWPGTMRGERVIGTVGPLTRNVEDAALVFEVLAGPDASDPEVAPVPFSKEPVASLRGKRIVLAPTIRGIRIAREVSDAIADLGTRLARAGAHVEEREVFDFDSVLATFRRYMRTQLAIAHAAGFLPAGVRPEDVREPNAMELVIALAERDRLIAESERTFADCDAWIGPPATCTAFMHCDRGAPVDVDGRLEPSTGIDHPTLWSTLTGSPSLVVPIATSARGLPIGAQLVGGRFADERLLALGAALAGVAEGVPAPTLV